MENNHTFLYFAYGSNLLKERLQLKNPSATVYCVARLKDYKLVFGNHKGLASDRWHGGVATIEHSPGDEVWGVVWRMNMSDLESLDSQENVTLGAYSPVELSVKTKGQELNCRTYIMNSCVYAPPSPQYLQVRLLSMHPCLSLLQKPQTVATLLISVMPVSLSNSNFSSISNNLPLWALNSY
uniref:Gamma-glutamylcyclotransferase b n=1 Tax=Sparus aurata TaxID=8175 RepID=A0A671U029_SPAAU